MRLLLPVSHSLRRPSPPISPPRLRKTSLETSMRRTRRMGLSWKTAPLMSSSIHPLPMKSSQLTLLVKTTAPSLSARARSLTRSRLLMTELQQSSCKRMISRSMMRRSLCSLRNAKRRRTRRREKMGTPMPNQSPKLASMTSLHSTRTV